MPRTIHDGLTMANLDASIDEIIAGWNDKEWAAFNDRYMNSQFAIKDAPLPRATIPAQADDDDLILGRIIHYARVHFTQIKADG